MGVSRHLQKTSLAGGHDPQADLRELGGALASLGACDFGAHFYSWRGASGAHYICSVFEPPEEELLAGFSGAAIIGVAREGATRRPICLMTSRQFNGPAGQALRAEAQHLGLNEWHVHFSAEDADLRDLAGTLLH